MTDHDPDQAARLETLEIRAAFQEDTLATLNEAIIRQQETIDTLRMEIDTMHERLRAMTANLSQVTDDDSPPPHY
ncbi:MAG: SlyX family protein [Gammaproteobacteria bacterium]|nr:SlyX family protein [Gammaproteobacteria bacterium]MCP5137315.1 SlyX family protein [Gammaproteobacteria bacterium]